jgi:hypothetical protein
MYHVDVCLTGDSHRWLLTRGAEYADRHRRRATDTCSLAAGHAVRSGGIGQVFQKQVGNEFLDYGALAGTTSRGNTF